MQQQKRLPAPPASETRRVPQAPLRSPRSGSSANVAIALGIAWAFVLLGFVFKLLSGSEVRFNALMTLAAFLALVGILYELKKR